MREGGKAINHDHCKLEQIRIVFAARDPVIIERSNLVNISKLIVKELIETSLKYGRMLDSDHMPLQHFFIVLEHVLRHGLRPKKVKDAVVCEREVNSPGRY